MKATRIWNLRMNLDEFNALCGGAFTEADRSALLGGLQLGCNGGVLPEQCSSIVRAAFEIGSGWRKEADGFSGQKSSAGKASAEARKLKYGTSQPNGVRGVIEQCPNQSTIHNHLININNKPPKPRKAKKDTTQIPAEFLGALTELCKNWPSFNTGSDGEKSDLRKWTDPVDLWDAMVKNFPNDNKKLMINCGLVHLENIKPKREFDKPGFAYAMCNFYGPKLAHWKKLKGAVEEAEAQ